jgi:hypothetical protein
VYQRAIAVPTHALEQLWRQYEAFEMAQPNAKTVAPKIIAEQRPRFQAARMAHRERKRRLDGVDAAAWPVPPGMHVAVVAVVVMLLLLRVVVMGSVFILAQLSQHNTPYNNTQPQPTGKGGPAQEQQLRLWRAYLDAERANPQRLERAPLAARVALAYDQALMPLRHFPEVRVLEG